MKPDWRVSGHTKESHPMKTLTQIKQAYVAALLDDNSEAFQAFRAALEERGYSSSEIIDIHKDACETYVFVLDAIRQHAVKR
jgi:hypothetical protein